MLSRVTTYSQRCVYMLNLRRISGYFRQILDFKRHMIKRKPHSSTIDTSQNTLVCFCTFRSNSSSGLVRSNVQKQTHVFCFRINRTFMRFSHFIVILFDIKEKYFVIHKGENHFFIMCVTRNLFILTLWPTESPMTHRRTSIRKAQWYFLVYFS